MTERLNHHVFLPWVWREHLARYHFASRYVAGKVVVDCACGEGWGSEIFIKHGAKIVEAVDREKEAVRRAAERIRSEKIRWHVSDAHHLPVENHVVDVYISLETIEHLREDLLFLKEAVRVLKRDGIFICSTPNRTVTNPGRRIDERPSNPFHEREYSTEEYKNLLQKIFFNVELYGQNPNKRSTTRVLEGVSRRLGPSAALFVLRLSKIRFFWGDSLRLHEVCPVDSGVNYEYLTAVCSGPRQEFL